MDPLEIKAETPEYVVDVYHTFNDNEVSDENQEYENDPLDVDDDQQNGVGNQYHHFGENANGNNENQENEDLSYESTLISVSYMTSL